MNEYRNGIRSGKTKTRQMDEIGNGSYRLSLRAGSKVIFIDKEALKIADILRGGEKDCEQAARNTIREQSIQLLLYLGNKGSWDISLCGDQIKPLLDDEKKGVEADVYLWNDNGVYKVIKVTMWWVRHQTPLDFIEYKILAHNVIFFETPYKLIGIQFVNGEYLFVLEQTYVRSMEDVYSNQQEIDTDMEKRGFKKFGSSYNSKNYIISDLNSKNVLKGIDNELYYIDPIIYPKI